MSGWHVLSMFSGVEFPESPSSSALLSQVFTFRGKTWHVPNCCPGPPGPPEPCAGGEGARANHGGLPGGGGEGGRAHVTQGRWEGKEVPSCRHRRYGSLAVTLSRGRGRAGEVLVQGQTWKTPAPFLPKAARASPAPAASTSKCRHTSPPFHLRLP